MSKLISILILSLLFSVPALSAQRVIDCNIVHKLHHDGDTISATYKLHMADNIGSMIIYGIFARGEKKSIISRQVIFKYTSADDIGYQLTSEKIISLSGETVKPELINKHYPLFFSQGDMQLFLTVRDFSKYSLAMTFASDIMFVCSKP